MHAQNNVEIVYAFRVLHSLSNEGTINVSPGALLVLGGSKVRLQFP